MWAADAAVSSACRVGARQTLAASPCRRTRSTGVVRPLDRPVRYSGNPRERQQSGGARARCCGPVHVGRPPAARRGLCRPSLAARRGCSAAPAAVPSPQHALQTAVTGICALLPWPRPGCHRLPHPAPAPSARHCPHPRSIVNRYPTPMRAPSSFGTWLPPMRQRGCTSRAARHSVRRCSVGKGPVVGERGTGAAGARCTFGQQLADEHLARQAGTGRCVFLRLATQAQEEATMLAQPLCALSEPLQPFAVVAPL
jgi:hypothetical protein